MPMIVVGGPVPDFLVELREAAIPYEIERWRRHGYGAVTLAEWEDNGGSVFPPSSTSDRLAHLLTDSGPDNM